VDNDDDDDDDDMFSSTKSLSAAVFSLLLGS
jgi:hypothetical protein